MLKKFKMFLRTIMSNIVRVPRKKLSPNTGLTNIILKHFSDDSQFLIGGGLEKLQGGLKEESYFHMKNYDLIEKIRENGGSKLKCEDYLQNWEEFEKVLPTSDREPRSLRDTCSANKHKNCKEEAFFMNEQVECTQAMKEKLEHEADTDDIEKEVPNDIKTAVV